MTVKHTENTMAFVACLLWSTAFVAIKAGTTGEMDMFSFAGTRFLLSGLILLPFCLRSFKEIKNTISGLHHGIIVGLVQTFALYALHYWGMTFISGAMTAIIVGSSPLIAALLSHYFLHNEQLNRKKGLTLILGFMGVVTVILSRNPFSDVGINELAGIILVFIATSVGIVGNMVSAKIKTNLTPMQLNAVQLGSGGIMLLVLGSCIYGLPDYSTPGLKFYVSLAWLTFVSTAACSLWIAVLRRPGTKVSDINVWKFVIPVSGACLSWALLPGEAADIWQVSGMVLVAVSVAVYNKIR